MIDPYEDFGEEAEAAELAEQDRLQEEAGFPVSFFGHLTEEEVTIKKEEHDEFGKELGQLWPEKKSRVGRRPLRTESEGSKEEEEGNA